MPSQTSKAKKQKKNKQTKKQPGNNNNSTKTTNSTQHTRTKKVEIPGFEPGASHMRSERSTTELYPRCC